MKVFFEILKGISTPRVTFYSVRFKNAEISEFEKFCQKDFPDHKTESLVLKRTLSNMGLRGAKPYYFAKPEKGAYALPVVSLETKKKNNQDFGIRLYCLYLTESIVVLLNGGIKTLDGPAQRCPNVSQFFNHAVKLADQMQKAKHNDYVRYEHLKIEFDEIDFDI